MLVLVGVGRADRRHRGRGQWPLALDLGRRGRAEAAADAQASLRAGRRIPLPAAPATIADGVRSLCVGERLFAVMRSMVDDIVTVTDAELLDALALVWSRTKQLVEPTAALPLAASAPAPPAATGSAWSSPAATSTPPPWPPASTGRGRR